MKYYEMERKSGKKLSVAPVTEDVFVHDEDDRPCLRFMLFPLLILQLMAILSQLL